MVEILPAKERASHYNMDRFAGKFGLQVSEDTRIFCSGQFNSHTVAIVGYILGLDYVLPYVKIPHDEQLYRFEDIRPRRPWPKRVLDVGCGRGQLEAALLFLNVPFTAIDFSADAVELTKKTCVEWSGLPRVDEAKFSIKKLALSDIQSLSDRFDTVVFSESIEHIPKEDFDRAMPYFESWHARLIIANKIDFHPIEPDNTGWNHIRRITEEVYDDIAKYGEVIFRDRSHLIIQL